ncbi:ATP-binding protein [Dactylosporangium sp. CA-092794]|uniref:ATP-binding protein n=1 Tax=Dactylosporangium sp. CA-092794 TaxID=3239929 RepID=UPI003D8E779F
MRRGLPLRWYLVGLLGLFVVAAGAGVWSGWSQARRDALAQARADAAFAARNVAHQLDVGLVSVRGSVDGVATNSAVGQLFSDPGACRLAFSLGDSDSGHLDVLRSDGTVACSSVPATDAAQARAYAGAPWLADALRGPLTIEAAHDARTGRPAVLITAPIPGLGVVAAFADLAVLGTSSGEQFGGARGLEFIFTGTDGATILTRSPEGARWAATAVRDSRFVPGADGIDVTGRRTVYAEQTVPGAGWHVYAGADRAATLASADRLARRQALVAGLGLLAGLLGVVLVQRRITRPVGRLRAAVRNAAASGRLDPAATVTGAREVTELGDEFNGLLATVDRELDERRRAEETALEHERNYRQMFDASPYPIVLYDPGTLALVAVNDAAVAYYGRPRDELTGMTYLDLRPPGEDGTADAAEPVERNRRQRHVKHDGTVTEVSITSYITSFGGRKVRCAVVDDVTEREHLERRLRQSERLESLGQLAAGIAHDFNNLVSIINGYAGMAAADVEPLAERDPAFRTLHADLTEIVAAGDRATALNRQLLAFARADPTPETRVVDLNAVVADIETLLRRALGEDVNLVTELAAQSWPVKVDPGRLEQVLVNLAVNARDAMPGGGTLTIETEAVVVDAHYAAQHPGLRPGRYMQVRVGDTGTGMSREVLERAFEPFFTTKPKGQGTGLGLATIYGIITQAGGHARIYSEPGHGTTVTALLPATEDTADTAGAPAAARPHGSGETILLVEDDESLRALTERILQRSGYTVLSAGTVDDARRLATAHARIDLLLTDVILPDLHGPALADEIRAVHPGVRVVYTSGYTETILASRGTMPPGATLLTKPVSAGQLLDAIGRELGIAFPGRPSVAG